MYSPIVKEHSSSPRFTNRTLYDHFLYSLHALLSLSLPLLFTLHISHHRILCPSCFCRPASPFAPHLSLSLSAHAAASPNTAESSRTLIEMSALATLAKALDLDLEKA